MADSLTLCAHRDEARIAAYVLMPSHLHLLMFIQGNRLSGFMRDFKKYVAMKVVKELSMEQGGIWMPRYDRAAITSERIFRIKLNYIHQNPVRAGLVSEARDWRWSSAADYFCDRPGPVPVWKGWS
jgi:putative transposase